MKVKELIEILEKLKQDEEILINGESEPFCEIMIEEISFVFTRKEEVKTCYLIEPDEDY